MERMSATEYQTPTPVVLREVIGPLPLRDQAIVVSLLRDAVWAAATGQLDEMARREEIGMGLPIATLLRVGERRWGHPPRSWSRAPPDRRT
jgi:hypothetical protein